MAGLDSNTKLYLPFDQHTLGATTKDGALEVLDYGSAGSILTQYGNATLTTVNTHVHNACLTLDGSGDYIDCGTTLAGVLSGNNITVSLWAKANTTTANDGVFTIGNFANTSGEFTINWGANANTINGFIDGSSANKVQYVMSDTDDWHHIVLKYDGTTLTLVVDNDTPVTVALSKTLTWTGLKTIIGGYYSSSYTFNGLIADVRVFGSTVSAENITKLYGSVSGTTEAIGGELLWMKGCQDQSGDGCSDSYHIPTFVGTAQLDTAVTKYDDDTTSILFDGDSDCVTVLDSDSFDIVASNSTSYTIDFFVKHSDHSGYEAYISQYQSADYRWTFWHRDGDGMQFYVRNSTGVITTPYGTEITDTDLHHVALIINGTGTTKNIGIYLDGNQTSYLQDDSIASFAGILYIGDKGDGSMYLDGNTSHLRIQASNIFNASPNVGKTDTITVPTAPYTAAAIALEVDTNDAVTVTESVALTIANNVSVSTSVTIAEDVATFIPLLILEKTDSISISDVVPYTTISPCMLPGNPQNVTWTDGTRYWRAWHNCTGNYIQFDYTTDPDNAWTENTNARITTGIFHTYSVHGSDVNVAVVYRDADSDVHFILAKNYTTSFSWGASTELFADATKIYKMPTVKHLGNDRWMVAVIEDNAGSYSIFSRTSKVTNPQNVSSWNAAETIDTATGANQAFCTLATANSGYDAVAVYTDGSALLLKEYSGEAWDESSTAVDTINKSFITKKYETFEIMYTSLVGKIHIAYVKSDNTIVERHYEFGVGLEDEKILSEYDDVHTGPTISIFGDYIFFIWYNHTQSHIHYVQEHISTGTKSEVLHIDVVSGLERIDGSRTDGTQHGAFILWEDSEGLHSKIIGLGLNVNDSVTVAENTAVKLPTLLLTSLDTVFSEKDVSYKGVTLPDSVNQPNVWDKSGTYLQHTDATIEDDSDALNGKALELSASDGLNGTLYYRHYTNGHYWYDNVNNAKGHTVEFRIKVMDDTSSPGTEYEIGYIYITDGTWAYNISIKGGSIFIPGTYISGATQQYNIDLTDTYHVIKAVTIGTSVKVYVDGTLRISATLDYSSGATKMIQMKVGGSSTGSTGVYRIDYLNYLVTRNPELVNTLNLQVIDSVSVAEDVKAVRVIHSGVSNSISITENIATFLPLVIYSSDSVSITENVATALPLVVFSSDLVSITEYIEMFKIGDTEVSDSISIAENITLELANNLTKTDSISIAENVELQLICNLFVSDSITITTYQTSIIPRLYLITYESITITEYDLKHEFLFSYEFENITDELCFKNTIELLEFVSLT